MKIDHYISKCAKYVFVELNEVYIFIYLHIKPYQNIYISLTADTRKCHSSVRLKHDIAYNVSKPKTRVTC